MGKEQTFTIKIYFIEPIDSISLLIDALINLEYEVYIVSFEDKNKLLKLIQKEERSILFLCIKGKREIEEWFEYIKKVRGIENTNIQLGAYVYNEIEDESRHKLISYDIPVIKFSSVKNKTMDVLNKIFTIYKTKNRRSFIRVRSFGTAEAYFAFRNKGDPIICNIIDISANAFSIEIDLIHKNLFEVNSYIENITIVLQGVRVKVTAKVLGFNSENPNIYILKFCSVRFQDSKVVYVDALPSETKVKIHNYIKRCLKHQITERLKVIKE